MRRTLRICRTAWTRFGNYPGSPSPVLPQSDDCGENWDCRFFTLQGSAGSVFSCEAGTIAFVKRTRSQPRQRGCSRGLGYGPNKQKLSPHNLFQQCSVAIHHIVNYPIAGNGFEVFSCAVNFGLLNQPQLHGTHRAFRISNHIRAMELHQVRLQPEAGLPAAGAARFCQLYTNKFFIKNSRKTYYRFFSARIA